MKKLLLLLLTLALCVTITGCDIFSTSSTIADAGGEGTLNLYDTDPLTLDPAIVGDSTSYGYVLQIFSGLVKLDDSLEPVADIASDWQISDDGLTYTFELRRDAVFQDGRKVTAEDFKYSWERACDPATGSQTASIYLGDIQGVAEMLNGSALSLSGVKVSGDYTLIVTLSAASSSFLAKMSYPTSFVVDKYQAEGDDYWWYSPNGTGPFSLDSWIEGSRLVLKRNPLYYGEKAKLSSVVYKLLEGVPMDLYEAGDIDVAGVSLSYYDRVTDPAGSFYSQLVISPELSLTYLGFDVTQAPFDDPAIRLAFAMAVDKEKLASLMFRDVVAPAGGILPPGMPGYNEALESVPYDVDTALALIASSEYGSAEALPKIVVTDSGYGGAVSSDLIAIVYDWEQAFGIDIEIRQLDPYLFTYSLKEEKDNIFYWGWSADYAHPQNFLEILFATGSTYNTGEYSNPEFDALLAQAAAETDEAASLALYRQAEQILVDDVACIPLWTGENMYLVQSYVKGYSVNALGQVALNKVYIEYSE
jgi:oligopeptide transport system substrate-binding protein